MIFGFEFNGRWAFIYDLPPLNTFSLRKQALRELRIFERVIQEQGAEGWYCRVGFDNVSMHRILLGLGAVPIRACFDEPEVVMCKEFINEQQSKD